MSSDQPGAGDWTSPSSSPTGAPPPPPDPSLGWGYQPAPPAAPGYGGWTTPSPYGWVPPQAPRPGVIPLRPLGVGELLDGAFTTIRRYPAATLGLSAAVMLVVEVVQILTSYTLLNGVDRNTTTTFGGTEPNGDYLARLFTVDGIVLVVTLIATALLTGMLATVIGEAVLGRKMGIAQAWAKTRPLFWRLLGATITCFLAWLVGGFVGSIPGLIIVVLGAVGGSDGVVILGAVLAVIGGSCAAIYVYVKLVMVTPSIVLERLTVRAALSRSWSLVRSSWWRVLGVSLLALIIATVISGIIVVPFDLAGGIGSVFSGDSDTQFHFVPLLLTGIGGLISSTLVRPFSAGVIALLYIDRRMRAEALDLTLQQAAASPAP